MDPTTPYEALGDRDGVLAIATAFYDAMERDEPELTALHDCPQPGRVSAATRDRFGLFLVGWLGGPQEYIERYGHPRLRMRHAAVPIDTAMRDAWLRCMQTALDARAITGPVRELLGARLAEVANFLRNRPD
ncbi:MAG: cyanoglobin [Deltaproteobacteria bacterium]|nr:cyanoglobin [Deltaproteobacteria bacterium]